MEAEDKEAEDKEAEDERAGWVAGRDFFFGGLRTATARDLREDMNRLANFQAIETPQF
jgi:hypothetical protein